MTPGSSLVGIQFTPPHLSFERRGLSKIATSTEFQVKTFAQSLSTYLKAAESWLSDEESPIVTALEHTAVALDTKLNASLVSQYRLLLMELDKHKPQADTEGGDELDDLIPSE